MREIVRCRHTFSSLLAEKSLMRHANPRITLEIYTHAVDRKKRSAQSKVVQMVLPKKASMVEVTA
jgi:hypothetical protein